MGLTWFSRDLYGFIWVSNGFTIVLYGLMLVYEGGKEKKHFCLWKIHVFSWNNYGKSQLFDGRKKELVN